MIFSSSLDALVSVISNSRVVKIAHWRGTSMTLSWVSWIWSGWSRHSWGIDSSRMDLFFRAIRSHKGIESPIVSFNSSKLVSILRVMERSIVNGTGNLMRRFFEVRWLWTKLKYTTTLSTPNSQRIHIFSNQWVLISKIRIVVSAPGFPDALR